MRVLVGLLIGLLLGFGVAIFPYPLWEGRDSVAILKSDKAQVPTSDAFYICATKYVKDRPLIIKSANGIAKSITLNWTEDEVFTIEGDESRAKGKDVAIPDYQSLMLPVLKLASDGGEYRMSDVVDTLATQLKLTETEREELLPSGKQPVFNNRVHWAKTYLSQAKLLESTRRAFFKITERGRSVLSENVTRIDAKFLRRFDEFNAFVAGGETSTAPTPSALPAIEEKVISQSTPDELLRATIKEVESALAAELIPRICAGSPAFFERLVVDLLLKMGYGGSRAEAGRALGKTGDGGIDGVIDQDQLGLDRIYIQAKKYAPDNAVSEPDIRNFCGSLGANKASKGVFVTTSYFTAPAQEFAKRHEYKVVLIDGELLARLMIHHSVGVRVVETMHYKKIDDEFFPDE